MTMINRSRTTSFGNAAKPTEAGTSRAGQKVDPLSLGRDSSSHTDRQPGQTGDVFVRSQQVNHQTSGANNPLGQQRQPQQSSDAFSTRQANPTERNQLKQREQELKKQDEDGGGGGDGGGVQIGSKRVSGQRVDLSKQIKRIMQTLSQLAKQKAEVEKEKRQALAKQSETGVKAKEKEHATIHQQENQFTGILSKLLALHGTKSPDAYVPVIQKSSKSGGGGKKR